MIKVDPIIALHSVLKCDAVMVKPFSLALCIVHSIHSMSLICSMLFS